VLALLYEEIAQTPLISGFANIERAAEELEHREFEYADSTASNGSMRITSDWIQNCIANHSHCKAQDEPREAPTRLLELCQPSQKHVRLIATANLQFKPTYMTLSHCWGSATFFKLTANTLGQLGHGILLDSLPKTFQDAASIACRLRSKYLWIDSLCILQGSLSDWQRETATMSNVYGIPLQHRCKCIRQQQWRLFP
jgi:hypothetical protein